MAKSSGRRTGDSRFRRCWVLKIRWLTFSAKVWDIMINCIRILDGNTRQECGDLRGPSDRCMGCGNFTKSRCVMKILPARSVARPRWLTTIQRAMLTDFARCTRPRDDHTLRHRVNWNRKKKYPVRGWEPHSAERSGESWFCTARL